MTSAAPPAARTLFGTDGIRGVAGELVSAELALGVARAGTARLGVAGRSPRVLVIRDTRESGEMLEAAVAAGIAAAGGDALLGGVLPTPAAPLLLHRHKLDMAIVLSASHNPYADNGIKFFGGDGHKLSDETELEIERMLASPPGPSPRIGRVLDLPDAAEEYLEALVERFGDLDLSGLRIALDCSNGATHRVAPEIFTRLGADVDLIAAEPDGRNINANCGSTHVHDLASRVRVGGHHAGFAFDGDGDRVLAVDSTGAVVDGDELIAVAAVHLRQQGRLLGDGVAVTVMTNFGFHAAMRDAGIEVVTTGVGDRYVLQALRERRWSFGGEQSGHIIEMGFNATGDGIASALLVLEALGGRSLADRDGMEKLPQKLVNVVIGDRSAFDGADALRTAIDREALSLAGRGRVLVRPSGTEPLVRVMVEAPSAEEADAVCERLVEVVRAEIA
ncbi:MAG: phosphoglucosamine mutase [Solirubrobacterales bacterium]|nr:phosphoglucosamine mutase [Solirubrobacterales bacterium]